MENNLNELSNEISLVEKWSLLSFQGKEQFHLNDSMEIITNNSCLLPNRIITNLNDSSFDSIIQNLLERYKETQTQLETLETEWNQQNDKIKFAGRLEKLKDYLSKAMILGDLNKLIQNIDEKQTLIKEIFDKNLIVRNEIVLKVKSLSQSKDWKNTTQAFKELIDEWKAAPPVTKEKVDKLWNDIDSARNYFYEQKRIYQEGIESDMMQNLDLKLELCELAERHQDSESWKETTQLYKELVEQWKQIGRVASSEKNEELWNRFSNAQNVFFTRKRANFESILNEQQQNLAAKLVLIEKAQALRDSTDWKETTQAYIELTEAWKQIGRVPREEADKIWQDFQTAKDHFFNNKRNHFETHKLSLEDNYAKKSALLKRMQQLQHSREWKEATDEIYELMNEWKAIGPVPKTYKDDLWEQFIAARNHFFTRKDDDRANRKNQFYQRLDGRIEQTRDFLNKLEAQQEEEYQKLEEFKQNVKNLDLTNPKDKALKEHLEQLMQQIEQKMPSRTAKIADVKLQLEEILQKKNAVESTYNNEASSES